MRPIFVVGPTAAGKSEVSLRIAHAVGGHVVNADSMQLYRGMDIGTAKLPPEKRENIPHHLLDIWDIDQVASVSEYQKKALAVIRKLLDSSITPIITGGSMMYVQSLIDNWEFPVIDINIRDQLYAQYKTEGIAPIRNTLKNIDPYAYEKIQEHDYRRIIRAVEVVLSTGKPFTADLPEHTGNVLFDGIILGIDREPELLRNRVTIRTYGMFEEGLESEVVGLIERGLLQCPTSAKAIGYAQCIDKIQGRIDHKQACASIITATNKYIRRQRQWFRRDKRIRWIDPELNDQDLNYALSRK